MAAPTISVVLPVRNGEKTLERALASVLASSEPDLELICVDDGSDDASAAILGRWAERDARVRALSVPRLGIVGALNCGLGAARAPRVARMDADDEMHPTRLAAQCELLDRDPELALVGCRVESFREGGLLPGYRLYTEWVNSLVTRQEIAREAFVECPVPHPTWMFRREVIAALGGYHDRPWPEDLDLLYRVLAAGHGVAKVPATLHRWRDHEQRLSRVDKRYAREAFAAVKAHFVGAIHPMAAAVVWGAGRTGRRFVRLLENEGVATRALIDINPARIGSRWRGIPILSPDDIAAAAPGWLADELRILGAVSSRGARGEIRRHLVDVGLREGQDFLMVA